MNENTARRLRELANEMAKVLPLLLDYAPVREAIITNLKLEENQVNGSLPLSPIWNDIELNVIEICESLMYENSEIISELSIEAAYSGMCDPNISVITSSYGPIFWVESSDSEHDKVFDNKDDALSEQNQILENVLSGFDESDYEIYQVDGETVVTFNDEAFSDD